MMNDSRSAAVVAPSPSPSPSNSPSPSPSANGKKIIILRPDAREFRPQETNAGHAVKNSSSNASASLDNNDEDKAPATGSKPKKSKEMRAGPRKRRKGKGGKDTGSVGSARSFDSDILSLAFREDSINSETYQLASLVALGLLSPHGKDMKERNGKHDAYNPVGDYLFTSTSAVMGNATGYNHEILEEQRVRIIQSQWAILAAEEERRRRIKIDTELEKEQENERDTRRNWAIKAIEKEKNDRLSQQFLNSLTTYFSETISIYHEDYEMVCPYVKLGCNNACFRSTLAQHLLTCQFAIECNPILDTSNRGVASKYSNVNVDNYEVVCPNAIMGCMYTCSRSSIFLHLESCPFSLSRQKGVDEISNERGEVTRLCEEERVRRMIDVDQKTFTYFSNPFPKDGGNRKSRQNSGEQSPMHETSAAGGIGIASSVGGIHSKGGGLFSGANLSIEEVNIWKGRLHQYKANGYFNDPTMIQLHDEIYQLFIKSQNISKKRFHLHTEIVKELSRIVKQIWPFASIELYGSAYTGLQNGINNNCSDVDLVIGFKGDFQHFLHVMGILSLFRLLDSHLKTRASHLLRIEKTIYNSNIPVIKCSVCSSFLDSLGLRGDEIGNISIDISLDSPRHAGIATSELVACMATLFPIIPPVVVVIKEFLKSKNLNSVYSGGLSSYGLTMLVTIAILQFQQFELESSSDGSSSSSNSNILDVSSLGPSAHNNYKDSSNSINGDLHQQQDVFRLDNKSSCISPFLTSNKSPKKKNYRHNRNNNSEIGVLSSSSSSSSGGGDSLVQGLRLRTKSQDNLSGQDLDELHIGDEPILLERIKLPKKFPSMKKISGNIAEKNGVNIASNSKELGRRIASSLIEHISDNVNSNLLLPVGEPDIDSSTELSATDVSIGGSSPKNLKPILDIKSPDLAIILCLVMETIEKPSSQDASQYKSYGYSARRGGFRFEIQNNVTDKKWQPICIEDPVHVDNNISGGSYRIAEVQACVFEALNRLRCLIETKREPPDDSDAEVANTIETEANGGNKSDSVPAFPLLTKIFQMDFI